MDTLALENVRLQYGSRMIAKELSVAFHKPEIVSIIGPNGSGKSTLLKALARLLIPSAGTAYLNGKDMKTLPTAQTAQVLAVLPQATQAPDDITVRDLVLCGRLPYQTIFSSWQVKDRAAVERALSATGLEELQHRRLSALSGGERQRAWLAMALAQEPKILLLDEPTTYLDIHYQLELMQLVRRLYETLKLTVVMVLHDLNHAARFSHRLVAVKKGEIVADGPVDMVFVRPVLENLYDVKVAITEAGQGKFRQRVCFPYETD